MRKLRTRELIARANNNHIQGAWRSAIDDYSKVLSVIRNNDELKAEILRNRESCYYRLENWDAGLRDNEALLDLVTDPTEAAVVLVRRGNTKLYHYNDKAAAIEAFTKAAEKEAFWASALAYEGRALLYGEERNYQLALEDVLSAQKYCLEQDKSKFQIFQQYLESLIAEINP